MNDRLDIAVKRMQAEGVPFSRQKLQALLASVTDQTTWRTNHQQRIHIGRVEGLLQALELDGRLRPTWHLASNGRLLCKAPSVQNLTPHQKACMEGVACIDAKAYEFAYALFLAGEHAALKVYEDGGDLHNLTADKLDCSRPEAKVFNIANMYGSGPKGIAARLGVPETRAAILLDRWWDAYPALKGLRKGIIYEARQNDGFVVTRSKFIRKIDMNDDAFDNKVFNTYISGSAADTLKDALVSCQVHAVTVHALIHDELVVAEKDGDKAGEIFQACCPFNLQINKELY